MKGKDMDDSRFEFGVVIGAVTVLPICVVAILVGGATGVISAGSCFIFTSLSAAGTGSAVVELRKGLAARERRRLEEARREAEAKADRDEYPRPSWRERIIIANSEMGIRDRPQNIHRVDFRKSDKRMAL